MGKSIICLGRGGLGKAFEERGIACYDRTTTDINDVWQINKLFNEQKPRYVINCTGMVGTGKCEHDPELAYMINVGGLSNIVYMCKKYECSLIHFSTIYVGDYNVYTRSKLIAENLLNDSFINKWTIRLPWVFGKHTDNFILSALKGKDVAIYNDELGYLSYDEDVVDYVIDNINSSGITTLANKGKIYRRDILDYMGIKYKLMNRTSNMPSIAPDPTVELRQWELAMKEFINGARTV